jgi:hypothetical protein
MIINEQLRSMLEEHKAKRLARIQEIDREAAVLADERHANMEALFEIDAALEQIGTAAAVSAAPETAAVKRSRAKKGEVERAILESIEKNDGAATESIIALTGHAPTSIERALRRMNGLSIEREGDLWRLRKKEAAE